MVLRHLSPKLIRKKQNNNNKSKQSQNIAKVCSHTKLDQNRFTRFDGRALHIGYDIQTMTAIFDPLHNFLYSKNSISLENSFITVSWLDFCVVLFTGNLQTGTFGEMATYILCFGS